MKFNEWIVENESSLVVTSQRTKPFQGKCVHIVLKDIVPVMSLGRQCASRSLSLDLSPGSRFFTPHYPGFP
jgi:hypothetical protein